MSKFDIYSPRIRPYYLRMPVASCSDCTSHPGHEGKLPGYIPGADPGVTTPPPACVIQFVVC